MKDTVNILISGSESPKFRLYMDAVRRPDVIADGGFLCKYDDMYDALLLSGGCDVSPELYGESNNGSVKCDLLRDKCEYDLIESFVKNNKPIFGICRGMQILNVYFGGTLIGDLPEIPKHHSDTENIYHKVRTVNNGTMSRLFGNVLTVNSFHHQAVRRVADGFVVTAYSIEDGVIEAIEHKEKPIFAVQFHPERMLGGELPTDCAKPLFDRFIDICRSQNTKLT